MPGNFQGMSEEEAKDFAGRWLPAWTGNDPDRLAAFYTDDCFYSDPALPRGVEGKPALLRYFGKLLATFPDWVWTSTAATPISGGFLNHWHTTIPVGTTVVECEGVCTVQLRDGLIERNQVYFDRSQLLAALAAAD